VRQLWDWKIGAEVELMSPTRVTVYGTLCSWTLARAPALRRPRRDRGVSRLRESVRPRHRAFAETYAGQNERDHAELEEAARAGRIAAERGL